MKKNLTCLHCLLFALLFISESAQAQFADLGPKGSPTYTAIDKPNSGDGTGQIHVIAFPPYFGDNTKANSYNIIYAGSPGGGLWKSSDAGNNWSVVDAVQHLDLNSVQDIAISNEVNYTIYIATGSSSFHWGGIAQQLSCGIYKSTDYGATFQPITAFNTSQNFTINDLKLTYKIAVSPTNANTLFVGTSIGLFRSLDKGVTWQNVFMPTSTLQGENPGVFSIAFSPNDPNTVYCSADQIYKSTSNGASGTFSAMTNSLISTTGLQTINANVKVANASGTDRVYENVYTNYSGTGSMNIYAFSGTSWSRITNTAWGYDVTNSITNIPTADRVKFDVRPKGDTIIAGYTATSVTVNNGGAWAQATDYYTNGHGDIHAVSFYPGGDSALVGTDGGIYKYRIHNATIAEQNYGLGVSMVWSLSTSRTQKGKFAIGKQDTNDDWNDGQNWNQTSVLGDGYAPVLWDRVLDSLFYFDDNGSLYTWNANTRTDYYNTPGCINLGNYDQRLMQNPDPNRSDEIFTTSAKGLSYSNQLPSATNFNLIDTIPQNYIQSRRFYVPSSAPDQMYTWTWVFDPSIGGNFLYKFNRQLYNPNNSGVCNQVSTLINSSLTPDTMVKPLDASSYTNTISCPTCYSSPVAVSNCFPVGDLVTSNTNINKVWVAFDYMRDKVATIKSTFPSQEIYRIRKSTDGGHTWSSDTTGLPQMPIERLV